MRVINEASLIGPGFRRFTSDNIHMGYWTPQLAKWSDLNAFEQKDILQEYSYISGVKTTGAKVTASPIICILESEIAERNLTVQITGYTGSPSGAVLSGDQWITGFSVNHQNGTDIYRREWVTGGDEYRYEFTISGHSLPGKTYLIPNKRIYEITNISVSPRREDQPLTRLGFYALADNGSKLLYSFNWNKIYDDLSEMLYSKFAAPKKCPTCNGSGYVADESDTCQQCNGYKYSGWNATGYMLDQIAKDVGLVQESGDSFEVYQDKIWAMKWWVTPTKKEIQKYFAHFADISTGAVEVTNNFRSISTSGVESIVDIKLPFIIATSRFPTYDPFWNDMADSIEPCGVNIRFSFLVSGNLTGQWEFEAPQSVYTSYYSDGVYYTGGTGNANIGDHSFGFYNPFSILDVRGGWYQRWVTPWLTYGYMSGQDDAVSGYAYVSGSTGISGLLTGTTWIKWAQPAEVLENDTIWATGETPFVAQAELWSSGTYYWDNFWASGLTGIQY